jgi:endonuclease-3
MSAQARDEVTIPIAERLFESYPTLLDLSRAKYESVLHILAGLNLNKGKSKNVILCAQELIKEYNGKIPHDLDKLIELSGVGRKTANVFLSEHGMEGLAVDTHVYYIARYLGWSKEKNPHKVEHDLKALFPKAIWKDVNPIMVKFGKRFTSRKIKNQLLDEIKKL